jgi:FixJ family two-component response regulator
MNTNDHDPMHASVVCVIDDDSAMRDSLKALLGSVDIRAETFSSIAEFMTFTMPDAPACLILDVRLKGQSGLAAQQQIAQNKQIPIIFVTGHGDVEMSVTALKAGAVDFIEKPFRAQRLLDSVAGALAMDHARRQSERWSRSLHNKYHSLTSREREVMTRVAGGLLNKQIAAEMSLSEITVKIHRRHAMQKMDSRSFADFVIKAAALGLNSI